MAQRCLDRFLDHVLGGFPVSQLQLREAQHVGPNRNQGRGADFGTGAPGLKFVSMLIDHR
ncbi:MAG: hypothetical protein NVS3B2_15330 [Ramlibacter sp.]